MKERQEVKEDKYRRTQKKAKLCNELYVSKEYCRSAM
jgi:hypothetical protein